MKLSTLNSKIILGSFVALSFISLGNKPSVAAINCNAVETFGNAYKSQILTKIHDGVKGKSYKINRRKTLKIHGVKSISFDKCRIRVATSVTLKRKVRRDASGTVKLRTDITSFNLPAKRICYKNARVTDVNLSRTLGIGEAIYKWVANKALPNNKCITLK
ncbi:MAG: hypothetical protein AAF316_08785 [Cyanobacteria bacterium P01_A01_bin.80]